MENLFVLGFILITMIIMAFKPIKTWKKFDILLMLLLILFLTIFIFVYFNIFDLGDKYLFVLVFLGLVIMIASLRFKRNVIIDGDLTEYDFVELERELNQLKAESELLRQRFITTLEISDDGIMFRNNKELIFGTDNLISLLSLDDNEFTEEDFLSCIKNEDVSAYRQSFKKISSKNPKFSITYRLRYQGSYIWVREVGKLIEYEKTNTIISYIKAIDFKPFPTSSADELNGLLTQKDLYVQLKSMISVKRPFYLVMISLYSIPDINIKYGRDAGDLMMGEYIKRLNMQFSKDNSYVYRVSGIQFALIIESNKKFDVLNRALESGGQLMNLQMSLGGVKEVVYPKLGIVSYPKDSNNVTQLILYADKALKVAIKDNKANYRYYNNLG